MPDKAIVNIGNSKWATISFCLTLCFFLLNFSGVQAQNLQQKEIIRLFERPRMPSLYLMAEFQRQDSLKPEERMPPNKKSFRFRGRPKTECDWFLITEFGLLSRVAGGNSKFKSFDDFPASVAYTSWELGLMHNLTAHQAVGLETFASIEWRDIGTGLGWGVKPRYRYWVNRDVAFDLSPGLLLGASEETFKPPGFSGSVGLGFKELLILTASVEASRFEGYDYQYTGNYFEENRVSWYLGAKTGAGLGTATGTAAAVAAAVGVLVTLFTLQD